jgi:5-methyltetrahydropteroyltriglutamate--homocysteine methyltransferase
MTLAAIHGYPRIGDRRQLKTALESYWAGSSSFEDLAAVGAELRHRAWRFMADSGVDLVPSNDFSLYDHVLDAVVLVDAVPPRYGPGRPVGPDTYFAMARGRQDGLADVPAMEMTKWFDTNYHFLVPEIGESTWFAAAADKPLDELVESAGIGIPTVPCLLGPVSFLLLSKAAANHPDGFAPLDRMDDLVEVYAEILFALGRAGARSVRLDEPSLVEDRSPAELAVLERAYRRLGEVQGRPELVVSTYFGRVDGALRSLAALPVEAIGLDFCAGGENLDTLTELGGLGDKVLHAGVVDGRNVWANDLDSSLELLRRLQSLAGEVVVSTSCSLMHVPVRAGKSSGLDEELRSWVSFAEDKVAEVVVLARALDGGDVSEELSARRQVLLGRRRSTRSVDEQVRRRTAAVRPADLERAEPLSRRRPAQRRRLGLPLLPTTTIGSFPQTRRLRADRAALASGRITDDEYGQRMRAEIEAVVAEQEDIGLDVVVHGEPERDDMVRWFAARLEGFALTTDGWVQSYGSRCVRPPILFGDISRPRPMTVDWIQFAQSLTERPVKAILTGPVTMLQWSFVRDDLSLRETARQVALAVRDEVADLDAAGVPIVQVDEAAFREGMPLRVGDRSAYLGWAVESFRLATGVARAETQVHTHMCYSEFGDSIEAIEALDVDVISVEAARSGTGLAEELRENGFAPDVGLGVYDIHSPRVPSETEMAELVERAVAALGSERVWVNPDCGLKTRGYDEVEPALRHMVGAARAVRERLHRSPPPSGPGS